MARFRHVEDVNWKTLGWSEFCKGREDSRAVNCYGSIPQDKHMLDSNPAVQELFLFACLVPNAFSSLKDQLVKSII